MNERIRQLSNQAYDELVNQTGNIVVVDEDFQQRFAELIVNECSQLLFDESERLFGLYSEEANWQSAEEYEVQANQCMDNISLIEKHFGVEE